MNTSIRTYQDLTAWQKAMALAKAIYAATQSWPREELYGLTNQIRRAVVSVPAKRGVGRAACGVWESAARHTPHAARRP